MNENAMLSIVTVAVLIFLLLSRGCGCSDCEGMPRLNGIHCKE